MMSIVSSSFCVILAIIVRTRSVRTRDHLLAYALTCLSVVIILGIPAAERMVSESLILLIESVRSLIFLIAGYLVVLWSQHKIYPQVLRILKWSLPAAALVIICFAYILFPKPIPDSLFPAVSYALFRCYWIAFYVFLTGLMLAIASRKSLLSRQRFTLKNFGLYIGWLSIVPTVAWCALSLAATVYHGRVRAPLAWGVSSSILSGSAVVLICLGWSIQLGSTTASRIFQWHDLHQLRNYLISVMRINKNEVKSLRLRQYFLMIEVRDLLGEILDYSEFNDRDKIQNLHPSMPLELVFLEQIQMALNRRTSGNEIPERNAQWFDVLSDDKFLRKIGRAYRRRDEKC